MGYGAVSAQSVVMKLGVADDTSESVLPQVAPPPPPRTGGIKVKGVGDLLIRFGKCCHPIPGDPIRGYISRGRGVTIHQATCHTVVNEQDRDRFIDVEWETAAEQTYPIAIRVEAYDRTGSAVGHQQRGRRVQDQHPRGARVGARRWQGHRDRHAPGDLGRPAGARDAALWVSCGT